MKEAQLVCPAEQREGHRAGHATATFARNLVLAIPTVIGSPNRSRTAHRSAERSRRVPLIRRSPPTSRKASSIDRPSTRGRGVAIDYANTALLASEYARMRGGTRSPGGTAARPARRQSPRARRTPWPRSSPRARLPCRRSRGGYAGWDRLAARPTRRRSRGRREESWPRSARTYVRIGPIPPSRVGTGTLWASEAVRGLRVQARPRSTRHGGSASHRSARTPAPRSSPRRSSVHHADGLVALAHHPLVAPLANRGQHGQRALPFA